MHRTSCTLGLFSRNKVKNELCFAHKLLAPSVPTPNIFFKDKPMSVTKNVSTTLKSSFEVVDSTGSKLKNSEQISAVEISKNLT